MTSFSQQATDQVDQIDRHRRELRMLHAGDAQPKAIAAKYDAIRTGLALAKVYAHLAVAEQLQALRADLSGREQLRQP